MTSTTELTSSPLAGRSRCVEPQPGKPDYRQWRAWQKAPQGYWCRQSAVSVGLVDRRPEPVGPGIAALKHWRRLTITEEQINSLCR